MRNLKRSARAEVKLRLKHLAWLSTPATMPPFDKYTGRMDLANMRENGVRSLALFCLDCTHRAELNVDDQPGDLAVKSFEPRMMCGKCGSRRIDVRPAWGTRPLTLPKP